MTKFVYSAAPPQVYSPPQGVVVLPLSEHPAIIAESRIEKLPGEPRRTPKRTKATQLEMITEYLKENSPATAYTIGEALGINWERVKWVILASPDVFQSVGRVQVEKVYRTLWGLVEDSRSA